jgi:hypothetical protein
MSDTPQSPQALVDRSVEEIELFLALHARLGRHPLRHEWRKLCRLYQSFHRLMTIDEVIELV